MNYSKDPNIHYVGITGHRPNKLQHDFGLVTPLMRRIEIVVEAYFRHLIKLYGPILPVTGLALGVDMLTAELCIRIKQPFIAAIPCQDQEKIWPAKMQSRYRVIVTHRLCNRIVVTDGPYDNHVMHTRNKWIGDISDTLIAVYDGSPGGTQNCVKYVERLKKPVIQINPKEL